MRSMPGNLKLPAQLVDELGGHNTLSGGRKAHRDFTSRKERRKQGRLHKKVQRNGPPPSKRQKLLLAGSGDSQSLRADLTEPVTHSRPLHTKAVDGKQNLTSTRKFTAVPGTVQNGVDSLPPSPTLSRAISVTLAAKLAEDDEEIAALEKKLGLKGKKKLPQAFLDDGLGELLEGFDGIGNSIIGDSNGKVTAGKWLAQKRANAKVVRENSRKRGWTSSDTMNDDAEICFSDGTDSEIGELGSESLREDATSADGDTFDGFGSESDAGTSFSLPKRMRENPYIAPVLQDDRAAPKYIPPSLRKPLSGSDTLVRLRKQCQGLINRLTEANLLSILGDVENIYRENPRQHVTSTLLDLLLVSVCEPTTLPDTLVILPAGFITAIYRVIGVDFGAYATERVVKLFDQYYIQAAKAGNSGPEAAVSDSGKETSNLITLLAELYNFHVVGSNLLFDYIRIFLDSFSELNAELLLKIIRISGSQLRQDDPSSLKDIVNMLQPAIVRTGEQNLSVRTKFMIESINDLKNNRMKNGAAASNITSEHTVRMKKTLGILNMRSIKGSEPLRIGLKDIQESDKRGKWWLVGARWAGRETPNHGCIQSVPTVLKDERNCLTKWTDIGEADLVQLARDQNMNTDIRRAIFVTIMSASDFQDAFLRLVKLKLKKAQELEIPKVIFQCLSAEKQYNPYYTLIAKKLCEDRKVKMAFQFCIWDLFKILGENTDDEEEINDVDEKNSLHTRQLVNLAKMYGTLIAEGSLSLSVLKNLTLSYLKPRTKMFLEVLFVTIFLHTQRQINKGTSVQTVTSVVSKVKNTPQMIGGLRYFLNKVVAKTDIAGGETEVAIVKRACKRAATILDSITAEVPEKP